MVGRETPRRPGRPAADRVGFSGAAAGVAAMAPGCSKRAVAEDFMRAVSRAVAYRNKGRTGGLFSPNYPGSGGLERAGWRRSRKPARVFADLQWRRRYLG